MSEQEIYGRFVDWLKQSWWGLPESDYLLPLIKVQYTAQEASLLTGMPFSATKLEELAAIKQIDAHVLRQRLDALAKKGLVFRTVSGEAVSYSLNDHFFVGRTAGWPGRGDEQSRAMAPLMNQYFCHGFFDQYDYTTTKGLRALPIGETLEDARQILPYEDLAKVLDQHDYFTVSVCPCKHRKNLDPDTPDCRYPTEICLHFGQLGHYIVENDMGREITRRETEEILRRCAEIGLVQAVLNVQEEPDTICNCCKCCCIWFEAFHKLKHSMSMNPSNYRVVTNQETCVGCGLCVKRCPMEARHLEDFPEAKGRVTMLAATEEGREKKLTNKRGKVSSLDPDLCIGCGVCAYKCPTKSLVLERQEPIYTPPKNMLEHGMLVMADFAVGRAERD